MGERLSAEDREAALATWFSENLTWEHFRDWGDEEWARNLRVEVGRIVAAAVAEERERIVRRMLNTVDPLLPGHEVRMACVEIARGGDQ